MDIMELVVEPLSFIGPPVFVGEANLSTWRNLNDSEVVAAMFT
jgi:hypothetical protein